MFSYLTSNNVWTIIPFPCIDEKDTFFDKFTMCEPCLVRSMCLMFTSGDDIYAKPTVSVGKPCKKFIKLAKKIEV